MLIADCRLSIFWESVAAGEGARRGYVSRQFRSSPGEGAGAYNPFMGAHSTVD